MADKFLNAIEKLNNKNYQSWCFKLKSLLKKEKCLSSLTTDCPAGEGKEKVTWQEADDKALSIISLCIEDNQIIHVKQSKTAREAWENLKKYHMKSNLSGTVRVLRKIFKTELAIGGDMEEHLVQMINLIDQAVELGVKLDDKMQIFILLSSLNEEYDGLVTALEARDEANLTIEIVKMKLLDEYEKKKKVTNESALVSRYAEKSARNVKFHKKRPDPAYITCFNCNEKGHYASSCNKKSDENLSNESKQHANLALTEKHELAFTSTMSYSAGWYVDSGATSHICRNRELFDNLNSAKEEILVANGEKLMSLGRGKARIRVVNGDSIREIPVYDAMYVPKAQCNLLSVKKLTSRGFKVIFENNDCVITLNGSKIAVGEFNGELYKLKEEPFDLVCAAIDFQEDGKQDYCIHDWHRKLAHRNLNDIRKIEDIHIVNCKCSNVCESCIKGKMTRKSFPKKAENKTMDILDIVVSDVCGPLQTESVGGSKYFVTFIDVHSRYCEIFFIKQKSEVFGKLKEFVERVSNQFKKKPKVIRSDRGSEYINKDIQEYLVNNGIKFECTVGYAPEQNGIAERKNRSLMEAARTMLFESGMSNCWWAEAIYAANNIQNRLVTSGKKKSPHELYFNEKPRFNDIHTFGCDAYVMIPKEKRRKLDPKAYKVKYLSVDSNSKGYRLANMSTRKVEISREVKFLDDKLEAIKSNSCVALDFESQYEEVIEDPEFDDDEEFHSFIDENENDVVENYVQEENIPEVVNEIPDVNVIQRPRRETAGKLPDRYNDFVMSVNEKHFEPANFKEAMNCDNREHWLKAMKDELKSINDNKTWELSELPSNRKAIGSKWVYKLKFDNQGNITRYKARLVAQGFNQKYGTDYDEIFAPVARSTTFRILLSVAAKKKYQVKHFDIKTAFLNGKLDEVIYMKQPPGFEIDNRVCKLTKSLYGLKQAARQWNNEIHRVLSEIGCDRSNEDQCLYSLKRNKETAYIIIHVDDLLIAGSNNKIIDFISTKIGKEFEIKDLGEVSQFLGIDVSKDEYGNYFLGQQKYIDKAVIAAGQADAKNSKIPIDVGYDKLECDDELNDNHEYRKLIGMLLYIATNTRPDIAASVSILSQKVSCPTKLDLNEVKRTIRYLKATRNLKLKVADTNDELELKVYSDANWAENRIDRKSNSGFVCFLGGGTVSWACRKQTCVSLSSTEAEYIALAETCQEVIWLQKLLKDFEINIFEPTIVNVDNQSCMKLADRQKFSNKTKHVDTKYHFIRDLKEKNTIDLKYCPTDQNIADMLTKPLNGVKLTELRSKAHIN